MGRALKLKAQVFLLAAGHGSRAGGPKAWRDQEGRPALAHHVGFLDGIFDQITVAVQKAWLPRCRELSEIVRWVAADPDRPPLASLQAALAVRRVEDPGFVYHVDMPVFERRVWEDLLAGLEGHDAALPTHDGRKGHPVLLAPRLFPWIQELDPERDGLDRFLRTRKIAQVPVDSPAILRNDNL